MTQTNSNSTDATNTPTTPLLATITFGAGCFWCVEAVFQLLNGVKEVKSGYMAGKIKNPTYREVCSGLTGHAEVCHIIYDENIISFEMLLKAFWGSHDPTTLNQQGADKGTQYRSAIFYYTETQKELSTAYKAALNEQNIFGRPVVTEISPAEVFYEAEPYHQNYYNLNGRESYCQYVIVPKLEKFKKLFEADLK